MATIKVIFRLTSSAGNEGTLYFRIIQRRIVKQIHTGYRIKAAEWNEKASDIIISGTPSRREHLTSIRKKLIKNRIKLNTIVATLDCSGKNYTAADVANQYLSTVATSGFIAFARKLISDCRDMGKVSAAIHYSAALNSFIRFHGDDDISFDDFNAQCIGKYECYLKSLDLCPNTTSYYMRKLRAIYNQACDKGLTEQCNPFKHAYTGVAKTTKRAVSVDVIKALREMDLRFDPLSAWARDVFLFSFYTRGMSMVDIAHLKKKNIVNGSILYRRHKTGQTIVVRWIKPIQQIVDRHGVADSDFLLPLIKDPAKSRRQYLSASHLVNRRLKKLGVQLGLPNPLTMYVARHTWASIARDSGIPIPIISQGMGHDSEKTTQIYLASLNTSLIDEANMKIISLLDQ